MWSPRCRNSQAFAITLRKQSFSPANFLSQARISCIFPYVDQDILPNRMHWLSVLFLYTEGIYPWPRSQDAGGCKALLRALQSMVQGCDAAMLLGSTGQASLSVMLKTLLARIKGFLPPLKLGKPLKRVAWRRWKMPFSNPERVKWAAHGDLTQSFSQRTACECQAQTRRLWSQRFQSVDDKYFLSTVFHFLSLSSSQPPLLPANPPVCFAKSRSHSWNLPDKELLHMAGSSCGAMELWSLSWTLHAHSRQRTCLPYHTLSQGHKWQTSVDQP